MDSDTPVTGRRRAIFRRTRHGSESRATEERFAVWRIQAGRPAGLREHVDRAFAGLKPGVFYRLESVESHLAFSEHNPLTTGLPPDQVAVFRSDQRVPPLEDELEEAGKRLLDHFVRRRLIPLGCVRAAIDDEDKLCIARQPRLDAYFGREVAVADLAPPAEAAARVVVQPDFSVIVIGLDPAPSPS